jgi:hypothetical protein
MIVSVLSVPYGEPVRGRLPEAAADPVITRKPALATQPASRSTRRVPAATVE